MTPLIIFLAVIAIIVLWIVMSYNGLIRHKNRVDESWSDIDVQLKRRYDLIPNLVETVKGYMNHEAGTLEAVIKARNQAVETHKTGDVKEQVAAENMLTSTLKSLFALSENYPDLKASQNFHQLQDELSDTENKIMAARRFYNTNVRDYNIAIETVPTNFIAGAFKFTKRTQFEAATEERANVKVAF